MRNFDFCGKWKPIFAVSIALILAGIVLFFTMGLNLGVDFSGGSMIYAEIGEGKFNVDDIRDIVNDHTNNFTVSLSGDNDEGVDIRLGDSKDATEIQDKIIAALEEKYELASDKFDVEYVGPAIGRDLLVNACWALLVAFVLMMLYIWLRFELMAGVVALIGIFHDVAIMFVFTILFQIQINTPFIAALLTIVGYSINNTIIIFDRIRSNRKMYGDKLELPEIVNNSIKETLRRSINTTVTTLIALVALYIFGVESIRTFTLPIIIGVLGGFYSSVFVSGPLWYLLFKGKKTKAVKKEKAVKL